VTSALVHARCDSMMPSNMRGSGIRRSLTGVILRHRAC
jgi:hypothetical protein